VNLGWHIELLRPLDIPVAVLVNASLLWKPDVREDPGRADGVSMKVDPVEEDARKRINRPHDRPKPVEICDVIVSSERSTKGNSLGTIA